MPKEPFIREKFTKERTAARTFAQDYFERYWPVSTPRSPSR
jgi:hypothetical protein